MSKLFSLLTIIALGVTFSCDDSVVRSKNSLAQTGASGSPRILASVTGCTAMSGNSVWPKTGTYNCHQYVKGALVKGWVDMTNGKPQAIDFNTSTNTAATIQDDDNFIRVCSPSYAMAAAHLPKGLDHSTLLIGTSSWYYSTPGGSQIFESGSPLNYGTACDYEFYAAIPDVTVQGPSISGGNYTFTLANRSKYAFIHTDISRWSYDHTKFTEVSRADAQLVIKPNSGVSGSLTVSATINTDATTGGCPNGVNGYEVATQRVPVRTNNFTISPPPPDCGGKLDGGSLMTVNQVLHGVQHTVVMNASSWTWVKTGGNATWYGYGNTLTFTISSGYATFNAYGSGCNLTMTFYAY